jgi:hypothetical protein
MSYSTVQTELASYVPLLLSLGIGNKHLNRKAFSKNNKLPSD